MFFDIEYNDNCMKRSLHLTLLVIVFSILSMEAIVAQHDCPAHPKSSSFDSLTFIRTAIPTDASKAEGIWLGQGTILRNGIETRPAFIPSNRPTWAIGIAVAWNYHRNLVHRVETPAIGYWLATAVQESELACVTGLTWDDPSQVSNNMANATTIMNNDGCLQIEGPGSAWGQLNQNYPLGRFPDNMYSPLIEGPNNFETSALVKSYYDVYTKEVYQHQIGWDVYESLDCTADEYAYEKISGSGYNGGINAFATNAGFLNGTQDANDNWQGLAATTAGYGEDVAKWISVLENNTSYPDYPTGSSFDSYYNNSMTWTMVTDYIGMIEIMYPEVDFAADVTPNVQAAFEGIAGSTAGTIDFQEMGPVIDQIILGLPREYPQTVEGSPIGVDIFGCSGEKTPSGRFELLNGSRSFCLGNSVTLSIIVDGGGGNNPTFKWYKQSDPSTIVSTEQTITITPTAVGTEVWAAEICNDEGCYKLACNTENSCMDSRNLCGVEIEALDCSTCSFVASATSVNTPCKGMNQGEINLTLTNAPTNYKVTYTGTTPLGTVTGSFETSGNTVNIDSLRDGSYNLELEDLSDPTCKAYTNVIINFDTDINEYIEAEITDVDNCVADLEANIVELPQPCNWKVRAYVPVYFQWENPVNFGMITSSGISALDRYTRVAPKPEIDDWNDVQLYESTFSLYSGDTMNFSIAMTNTPGATQLRAYNVEVYDENDDLVYMATAPAGGAQYDQPYDVGYYVPECPYSPPAYTISWAPSLINETSTDTTSSGQANVTPSDVLYTVTAVNNANSTCVLTDTVTVIGDVNCVVSCEDPGTATLSPASPSASCTGIELTASESGTAPTGGFQYEFFNSSGSVQGPSSTNTYTANSTEDYYVVISDLADPASCVSTSNTVSITINSTPTGTGTITGNTTLCNGETSVVYTVSGYSGVNTYTWTVPTGLSIVAGQGTNAITVDVSSTSAGDISVTPSNTCGDGTDADLTITINDVPSNAGAISGETTVCENATGEGYSIAAVTGADDYTWELPTGATIASGANSNSITVDFGTSGGEIKVTPSNSCGSAETDSIDVATLAAPDAAGTITGTTSICDNASGESYSIAVVTNATSYEWSITPSATIVSGQSTNSIVVDYGTASSYTISVTPKGTCGDGTTSQLTVTNSGSIPGAVSLTQSPNPVCIGESVIVSAALTGGGATPTVNWYVDNTLITGNTTDTIEITNVSLGQIVEARLVAGSTCATGLPASSGDMTIQTSDVPTGISAITGESTMCNGTTGESYSVASISEADDYTWSTTGDISIASGQSTNAITVDFTGNTNGTITITPSNGCGNGTSASINVTINDVPDQGTLSGVTSVCPDQSNVSYTITGATNATDYTWVTSNATIISGQNTNTLIVDFSSSAASIMVTPSNGCGDGASSTINVSPSGVVTGSITGNSTPFCNGTGEVYSVPNTTGSTYSWTVPSGATITSGQSTNSITVSFSDFNGNVSVVETSLGGCDGSQVDFAISLVGCALKANFSTNVETICDGESVVFTDLSTGVTAGTNYAWDFGSGASPATATGVGPHTVVYTGASMSTPTLTIQEGPLSDDTVSTDLITINTIPDAAGSMVGNVQICETSTSETYSIASVNGADGYTWAYPTGTIINAGGTGNTVDIDLSNATDGTITVTPTNSCGSGTPSDLTLDIISSIDPAVTLIASKATICFGEDVDFTVTTQNEGSAPVYEFLINNTSVQNGNSSTLTTNALTDGSIVEVVLTSNAGCLNSTTDSDQVEIQVNQPLSVAINESSTTFCENTTLTLNANGNGTTYTWYKGSTVVSTGETITLSDAAEAGDYTVETSDGGVCSNATSSSITIGIDELPIVSAGPDLTVDAGNDITLEGSASIGNILWSPATTLSADNIATPVLTTSTGEGGEMIFTMTVTNGNCIVEDNVTVDVVVPILIPNVFSPNEDGENDVWKITGLETHPNFVLTVFNRWGAPVYKTFSMDEYWEGKTNKGKNLPTATYYYVLTLLDGTEPMSGSVTIIR